MRALAQSRTLRTTATLAASRALASNRTLVAADYLTRVKATRAASLTAYWPLAEAAGTTITDASGRDRGGTYTGVTLGAAGIGDGRTAASFDGVNDVANVASTKLTAAFSSQELTFAGWFRVAGAGTWTDATARYAMFFAADVTNNYVRVLKTTINNTLSIVYRAGGVTSGANIPTAGPTGWVHAAIAASKSADQVRIYLNGLPATATFTGVGTWAGPLAATRSLIGADTTAGANCWSGTLAHWALWSAPLTAAEIFELSLVLP